MLMHMAVLLSTGAVQCPFLLRWIPEKRFVHGTVPLWVLGFLLVKYYKPYYMCAAVNLLLTLFVQLHAAYVKFLRGSSGTEHIDAGNLCFVTRIYFCQ